MAINENNKMGLQLSNDDQTKALTNKLLDAIKNGENAKEKRVLNNILVKTTLSSHRNTYKFVSKSVDAFKSSSTNTYSYFLTFSAEVTSNVNSSDGDSNETKKETIYRDQTFILSPSVAKALGEKLGLKETGKGNKYEEVFTSKIYENGKNNEVEDTFFAFTKDKNSELGYDEENVLFSNYLGIKGFLCKLTDLNTSQPKINVEIVKLPEENEESGENEKEESVPSSPFTVPPVPSPDTDGDNEDKEGEKEVSILKMSNNTIYLDNALRHKSMPMVITINGKNLSTNGFNIRLLDRERRKTADNADNADNAIEFEVFSNDSPNDTYPLEKCKFTYIDNVLNLNKMVQDLVFYKRKGVQYSMDILNVDVLFYKNKDSPFSSFGYVYDPEFESDTFHQAYTTGLYVKPVDEDGEDNMDLTKKDDPILDNLGNFNGSKIIENVINSNSNFTLYPSFIVKGEDTPEKEGYKFGYGVELGDNIVNIAYSFESDGQSDGLTCQFNQSQGEGDGKKIYTIGLGKGRTTQGLSNSDEDDKQTIQDFRKDGDVKLIKIVEESLDRLGVDLKVNGDEIYIKYGDDDLINYYFYSLPSFITTKPQFNTDFRIQLLNFADSYLFIKDGDSDSYQNDIYTVNSIQVSISKPPSVIKGIAAVLAIVGINTGFALGMSYLFCTNYVGDNPLAGQFCSSLPF